MDQIHWEKIHPNITVFYLRKSETESETLFKGPSSEKISQIDASYFVIGLLLFEPIQYVRLLRRNGLKSEEFKMEDERLLLEDLLE